MESVVNLFTASLLVVPSMGMLVLGAFGGFLFAKRRRTATESPVEAVNPEEYKDDPAAPVTPMSYDAGGEGELVVIRKAEVEIG